MGHMGIRETAGMPGDWVDDAPCKGRTSLFFPPGEYGSNDLDAIYYSAAKGICERCPFTAPCLSFAQRTGQRYGVFGGLSPLERRKLARRTA